MDKICRVMMNLIGSEICGNAVCADEIKALSDDELKALYKLSKSHDLAHLVGNALIKNKLISDNKIKSVFEKELYTAVFRYESINYELGNIKEILSENEIPFIPLKGSVIREYYPEPWQRTSCDIDVLVKKRDLDKAKTAIIGKCGYRVSSDRTRHDISLFSFGNVHLELHYTLIEDDKFPEADRILNRCWEYAYTEHDGGSLELFSDSFFYFYHILHMAKHIKCGGCGVRPFLDLWILNHRVEKNENERNKLLLEGGIKRFAQTAEALSEEWFSVKVNQGSERSQVNECDELIKILSDYVINGGVYGTTKNRVMVQRADKSKLGYLFSRIFLSCQDLSMLYPNLEKHKWLFPFYQVRRWFRILFCGGRKRAINEIKLNQSLSEEKKQAAKRLIDELGL